MVMTSKRRKSNPATFTLCSRVSRGCIPRTMKMPALFLIALLLVPHTTAVASDSVRVEARLATEHDDPKEGVEEVIKKQLVVTISGAPKLASDRLTVRAKFYADDLTAGQVVVEKELTVSASLDRGRATLELPEVTFRHTPAHGQISGTGRRTKSKRIPAAGRRYHGWSVEVLDGEKLLGEAYSIISLKPGAQR
jgi:hypothetical protein